MIINKDMEKGIVCLKLIHSIDDMVCTGVKCCDHGCCTATAMERKPSGSLTKSTLPDGLWTDVAWRPAMTTARGGVQWSRRTANVSSVSVSVIL